MADSVPSGSSSSSRLNNNPPAPVVDLRTRRRSAASNRAGRPVDIALSEADQRLANLIRSLSVSNSGASTPDETTPTQADFSPRAVSIVTTHLALPEIKDESHIKTPTQRSPFRAEFNRYSTPTKSSGTEAEPTSIEATSVAATSIGAASVEATSAEATIVNPTKPSDS